MSRSTQEAVSVTLSALPSGGLAVAVNTEGCTPMHAWLEDRPLELLRDLSLLQSPSAVLIPGLDHEVVEAEAAWGRAAARALFTNRAIAVGFARALGESSGGRHPPPIVLSLPDTEAEQDLPWELLYDSPSGESLEQTGQGVVVRLVPCARRPAPPSSANYLRSLMWAPDASEPAVATLVDAASVRMTAEAHVVHLPADLARLPRGRDGVADILHIVCHGERDLDTLTLLLSDDQSSSSGTTAALLQPLLDRCRLVLLDVCHGGMVSAGVLGGLGRRLVAAGAPAVITTGTTVGVDAAKVFADGCLTTLQGGVPLHAAVREGRRRVAALAVGHPEVRWHNHRLLVGHSRTAGSIVVLPPAWRPEGFPRACPDADALWETIRGYADAIGFLGSEALLLGLLGASLPSRIAARVSYRLGHQRAEVERRVAALRPYSKESQELPVSPRLQKIGTRLTSIHQSLVSLVGTLCDACESADRLAAVSSLGMSSHSTELRVEVMGGPEDGRMLSLGVGSTVGRWSPELPQRCSHTLYEAQPAFDPALSRSGVLEVVGPAQVRLLRGRQWHVPAMEQPDSLLGETDTLAGFEESVGTAVRCQRGDVLTLRSGDLLWLSAVSAPDAPTGFQSVTALRVVATPLS